MLVVVKSSHWSPNQPCLQFSKMTYDEQSVAIRHSGLVKNCSGGFIDIQNNCTLIKHAIFLPVNYNITHSLSFLIKSLIEIDSKLSS